MVSIGLSLWGSDREDRSKYGRSFAMSRISWCFRPPMGDESPEAREVGSAFQRDVAVALILYVAFLPLIALWRAIALAGNSSPRPGDIISMRAVPDSGIYWLASVGRTSKDGTAVRVLVVTDRRPRGFRREDLHPHDEPIIVTPRNFRIAHPRFVWRGPTEFWIAEPYVLET
jgi:hypothetical protein